MHLYFILIIISYLPMLASSLVGCRAWLAADHRESMQEYWLLATWTLGATWTLCVVHRPTARQGRGSPWERHTQAVCSKVQAHSNTGSEVPLTTVDSRGGEVAAMGEFQVCSWLDWLSKAAYLELKGRNTGGLVGGWVGKYPESCNWDMMSSVLTGLAPGVWHLGIKDFRKATIWFITMLLTGFTFLLLYRTERTKEVAGGKGGREEGGRKTKENCKRRKWGRWGWREGR